MNADGSGRTFLTTGPETDFDPVFSPDGTKVFFVRAGWFGHYSPIASSTWHEMDIFSVNIDGTDLKQITFDKYYQIRKISVHPDGTTILAELFEPPYSLWIIPISSPADKKPVEPGLDAYKTRVPLLNLIPTNYLELVAPSFSPDGKSLMFTRERDRQIYIMDIENGEARRITNMAEGVYDPVFSDDGSKVLFVSWRSIIGFKESAIWVMNIDGTDLHTVNAR